MKLFRRRRRRRKFADTSTAATAALSKEPLAISLSTEQKRLLENPVDPRVDRILQRMHKIYADKAAAERALNARRATEFPHGNSEARHVIQDENGFWRIVPGPAPEAKPDLFDAI
jgi:hypothetical protein